MTLEPGRQEIIAEVVEELRSQGVAGLGSTRGFYAGPLFVVAEGGDMSGIVIGARTGSQGGGQEDDQWHGHWLGCPKGRTLPTISV